MPKTDTPRNCVDCGAQLGTRTKGIRCRACNFRVNKNRFTSESARAARRAPLKSP